MFELVALTSLASPAISGVAARQRYPWNGLVDVVVTIQGTEDDADAAQFSFVATNGTTLAAIPVAHISCNGTAVGSGDVWTRKFIWDAKADVGAVKIDDVILSVDACFGVQLWENGPYWATCNVGATKPEESGYYFWWATRLDISATRIIMDGCPLRMKLAFHSAVEIVRRMVRITRNSSRMATLTRQATSSLRTMRRQRISAHHGGCRRMRKCRRSSATARPRGRTIGMVQALTVGS